MKKNLAAGLCIAVLLCLLPTGASAAAAPWDGSAVAVPTTYSAVDKTISIGTPDELAWVSAYSRGVTAQAPIQDLPASFQGYTLLVTEDIDLGNHPWEPIAEFRGRFIGADGQLRTISNLYADKSNAADKNYVGLFGRAYRAASGVYEFENIRIDHAQVKGAAYVGALAGNGYTCDFNNCQINDAAVNGNQFVGGLTGQGYSRIMNCTVSNSNVIGTSGNSLDGDDVGGIIGMGGEGATIITDCKVTGCTISAARQAGGIVGTLLYGNTVSGCTVSGTTVGATLPILGRSGGIVGELVCQSGQIVTLQKNTVAADVGVTARLGKKAWLAGGSRNVTAATESQYLSRIGNQYLGSGLSEINYGA